MFKSPSFRRIKKYLNIFIGLGTLCTLLCLISINRGAINWNLILRSPHFVALSLFACLISVGLSFLCWYFFFCRNLKEFGLVRAYRLYALPAISRYLPGGQVWQYLSLISHAEDRATGTWAAAAYAQSTVCSMIAGITLCIASMGSWIPGWKTSHLIISYSCLITAFFLATSSRWQSALLNLLRKKYPSLSSARLVHRGELLVGASIGLVAWSMSALAGMACEWVVTGKADWTIFWPILSAYAVATFGAYFTFLSPGGLGVREGFFVALLSRRFPVSDASFIALGAAFSLIIADMLFTIPILGTYRQKKYV